MHSANMKSTKKVYKVCSDVYSCGTQNIYHFIKHLVENMEK